MWGWGLASRKKSVPGLDKTPSWEAWHFKGKACLPCCLRGSWQVLTNPLQFAPTNPNRSLGNREPFFTQSCA